MGRKFVFQHDWLNREVDWRRSGHSTVRPCPRHRTTSGPLLPLTSKVLRASDIFDPKVLFTNHLDELKNKFKTVATRFSNLIGDDQIPQLLDTVSCLQVKEMATILTPVQIFSMLLTWRGGKYSLVGRLGCAYLFRIIWWGILGEMLRAS